MKKGRFKGLFFCLLTIISFILLQDSHVSAEPQQQEHIWEIPKHLAVRCSDNGDCTNLLMPCCGEYGKYKIVDLVTYTLAGHPFTLEDGRFCVEMDKCQSCEDSDNDGICDEDDNCQDTANPGQEDSDDDGIGDVCEEYIKEVNIYVTDRYKKEHSLPLKDNEYEKQGLNELKEKCSDCCPGESSNSCISGIITEYDEIVCEAEISIDGNPLDYDVAFRIIGLKRGNKEKLPLRVCNREGNSYICSSSVFRDGLVRGKKVFCKVELNRGLTQTIHEKESGGFAVARFIYYVLPINRYTFGNLMEQYRYYVRLSEVDKKLEYSGKPVLLYHNVKFQPPFSRDDVDIMDWIVNYAEDNLRLRFNPNMDDKIIGYYTYNSDKENLGCRGTSTLGGPSFLITDYPLESIFAHEIGHASINSKLCDEYIDDESFEMQKKGFDCRGDYPKCCADEDFGKLNYFRKHGKAREDDCYIYGEENTSADQCPGMPSPNKKGIPNNDVPDGPPFGPYFSVMGGYDYPSYHYYPLSAGCPLRGCP